MNTKTTNQQLIGLAAPLVLGSMLQQLYNTADSMIIGRFLGAEAFAAAGVGGTVMNLFMFVLTGCCTGASVILAQVYGCGDHRLYRRESAVAAACGLLFSLILSTAGLFLLRPLLYLLKTPQELLELTAAYLQVILLTLPVTFFYNLYAACLRAAGNTQAALIVLAVAVGLNTILDWLFVGIFHSGISGAAWATAISQAAAVAVCAAYMHHVMPELFFGWRDFTWDFVLIHKTAAYGAVSALQQSSLYLGKLLVMGTVNTLGTETISGYTAAMRVEGFINSFGDSGAAASSVLIGQRFGAGKPMEVKDGMKSSMRLHLLSGGILALLMFASASPVICFLLNGTGSAASEGIRYVRLVAMFYLFNFIGCAYVGYFRGVGRLRIPTAGSTLQISVRVLLSCLLAPKMGLAAIALATGAGWIVAVIFHTFHYKTTAEPNPQKP